MGTHKFDHRFSSVPVGKTLSEVSIGTILLKLGPGESENRRLQQGLFFGRCVNLDGFVDS